MTWLCASGGMIISLPGPAVRNSFSYRCRSLHVETAAVRKWICATPGATENLLLISSSASIQKENFAFFLSLRKWPLSYAFVSKLIRKINTFINDRCEIIWIFEKKIILYLNRAFLYKLIE